MRHRTASGMVAVVIGSLMALALAACGGDDAGSDGADGLASSSVDDVDIAAESGDGAGGDADGSGGASGDGDVDAGGADFPIPAPDGLVVDALVASGLEMQGQRQLYYEDGDFDRVVAFYDDWTSQNPEWTRAEANGAVVYQSIDGDGIRMITITPDHDPGAQAEGPVTFVLLVAG